jgi:hypothetical protein
MRRGQRMTDGALDERCTTLNAWCGRWCTCNNTHGGTLSHRNYALPDVPSDAAHGRQSFFAAVFALLTFVHSSRKWITARGSISVTTPAVAHWTWIPVCVRFVIVLLANLSGCESRPPRTLAYCTRLRRGALLRIQKEHPSSIPHQLVQPAAFPDGSASGMARLMIDGRR